MNGPARSAVQALLRVFDDLHPYNHGWVQLQALLQPSTIKALGLLADNGIVIELPLSSDELPLTREEATRVLSWMQEALTEDEEKQVRDLEIARVRTGGEADFLRLMRDSLTFDDYGGYPLIAVIINGMTLDSTHLRIVRVAVEKLIEKASRSDATEKTVVLESSRAFGPDHVTLGAPASTLPPFRRLTGRGSNQGLREFNTYDAIRQDMVRLADGWAERPLCFFLGAGFSLSSTGMPLGNDMRDHALRAMFPLAGEESGEQLAARLYRMLYDRRLLLPSEIEHSPDETDRQVRFVTQLTLERVMHAHDQMEGGVISPTLDWFDERHLTALADPGGAVRSMRALIEHAVQAGRRILIFTVNFDELLEPAFRVGIDAILCEGEVIEASLVDLVDRVVEGSQSAGYVKLHGTISDRGSLLIDVAATTNNPTMRAFQEGMSRLARAGIPILYVGHSMRDLDIRPALASQALRDLDERWVVLDGPTATIEEVQRTRAWSMTEHGGHRNRMHHATADDWMAHFAHIVDGRAPR